MRLHGIFGSLAILIAFSHAAAAAEECAPLKQIASLDMKAGPGGSMLVPVSINNQPQQMMLATGGSITSLRQDAVAAMGLHPIDGSRIRLLSGDGTATKEFVQIDFSMGGMHTPDLQVMVLPVQASGPPPFAGALAGDILSLYDVEMDFAGHKLNLFSKDHCPGHVLYWNPSAVAVVPVSLQLPTGDNSRTGFSRYSNRGSQIYVPVSIDGKNFKAALATGLPTSSMGADTAKYMLGITADSPGAIPLGTADGNPDHKIFEYSFPTLTFDAVTVTNARFRVYPNLVGSRDPNNSIRTDSRVKRIDDNIGGDIFIGMDVLRKLRLYVAYGERRLYVSPATAAAQPATAAQQ